MDRPGCGQTLRVDGQEAWIKAAFGKEENRGYIMLTIAFIFATEGCNPDEDSAVIRSKNITVHVKGVSSYSQAAETARQLVEKEGCEAIELCPAFGSRGVACIQEAVGDKIPVGVVRYDQVPALGGRSGDALFNDIDKNESISDELSEDERQVDEAALVKLVNKIVQELHQN